MPDGRGGFLGTHHRGEQAAVQALDVLIKLVRCTATVQARLDASIRELGVTPSQFGLLEALLHLGPQEPCHLGPKLLTSRPNVVLIVDQLEERGLVRRAPVPGDKRRVLVALTPAGRRLIRRLFETHVERVIETFAPLSAAEQGDLAALCKRLGLAWSRDPGPGSGFRTTSSNEE